MGSNTWYHVSSHGAVLFCIAAHPGCTTSEMAEALSLTRRTIWGIIGDLRRAGMLHVRREGRRHHYTVNLDAELRLPFLRGRTLRAIVGQLPRENR